MAFNLGRLLIGGELRKYGSIFVRNLVNSECRCVGTSGNAQQQQQPAIRQTEEEGVKNTGHADAGNAVDNDHGETSFIEPSFSAEEVKTFQIPEDYRFRYPEFLPNPRISWRNPVREKLERQDMLARRTQIHIPEFYVGSVMRVTLSNIHQPEKTSSFLGICIQRDSYGLRSNFILRNVIDGQGCEIKFELYDPRLRRIDVLRLQKRLDEDLLYLRDALPEYSTFPLDMKPELLTGGGVPVNPTKVKLRPRPWSANWHQYNHYKGIENIQELINDRMRKKHPLITKPYEKYDLMKAYRSTIPEEDQKEIYEEIFDEMEKIEAEHDSKELSSRSNQPVKR